MLKHARLSSDTLIDGVPLSQYVRRVVGDAGQKSESTAGTAALQQTIVHQGGELQDLRAQLQVLQKSVDGLQKEVKAVTGPVDKRVSVLSAEVKTITAELKAAEKAAKASPA